MRKKDRYQDYVEAWCNDRETWPDKLDKNLKEVLSATELVMSQYSESRSYRAVVNRNHTIWKWRKLCCNVIDAGTTPEHFVRGVMASYADSGVNVGSNDLVSSKAVARYAAFKKDYGEVDLLFVTNRVFRYINSILSEPGMSAVVQVTEDSWVELEYSARYLAIALVKAHDNVTSADLETAALAAISVAAKFTPQAIGVLRKMIKIKTREKYHGYSDTGTDYGVYTPLQISYRPFGG